jgi:hypothetical protein
MGVAIAGAAIGAAASLAGGILSAKAAKKEASRQRKHELKMLASSQMQTEARSKQAQAEQALALEGQSRAEAARMGLFGSLGDPSTYGEGYQGGGFQTLGASMYEDRTIEGRYTAADLFSGEKNVPKWMKGKSQLDMQGFDYSASAKLLNVDNFLSSAKSSKSFQIVSQLVGESAELLNRDGPAWDRLQQATIGTINEGAATMQREMADQISRDLAKGGTARRQGLATAQRLQSLETVNRMRTQQTWQASLQIDDYIRKNAANTQVFAQAWVANHEGVRDQVTNAMSNLTTLWTQNALAPVLGADEANMNRYAYGMRGINDKAVAGFGQDLGKAISGFGKIAGSALIENKDKINSWVSGLFGGGGSSSVASSGNVNVSSAIGFLNR